jgi:hypothetical protein
VSRTTATERVARRDSSGYGLATRPSRAHTHARGRRLANGVYFCTLENGAKRISRKVVLTEWPSPVLGTAVCGNAGSRRASWRYGHGFDVSYRRQDSGIRRALHATAGAKSAPAACILTCNVGEVGREAARRGQRFPNGPSHCPSLCPIHWPSQRACIRAFESRLDRARHRVLRRTSDRARDWSRQRLSHRSRDRPYSSPGQRPAHRQCDMHRQRPCECGGQYHPLYHRRGRFSFGKRRNLPLRVPEAGIHIVKTDSFRPENRPERRYYEDRDKGQASPKSLEAGT